MATSERVGDWCQTFTGRQFWPCDPRPADVCLEDIAHALALQCRFAGHCRVPYSVAEHCVRVSHQAERLTPHPRAAALRGLLHDASEAYLVDVPRPIKPALAGYGALEARVQAVVDARFGVSDDRAAVEAVHCADEILLATEARDLMAAPPASWHLRATPLSVRITPWSWREAEARFLARFTELTGQVSP